MERHVLTASRHQKMQDSAVKLIRINRLRNKSQNKSTDVISLRRLVNDVKRNWSIFTRENYVCYDGLPYDYATIQTQELRERHGQGPFCADTFGPRARTISRFRHEQFDRLSRVSPDRRARTNLLPKSIIVTIDRWLEQSGAEQLKDWSDNFLAHAAGPERRNRSKFAAINPDKISEVIRALARVTEAISFYLVDEGGRSNAIMPVATFDQFEKLDFPIMLESERADIEAY